MFGDLLRNNLAFMKNCPGRGRGVQGTLNYLSVQVMIAFTIQLASNKCPYVYNLRHLFAVKLNLYRQDCRNSALSAYSIANRTAWSPGILFGILGRYLFLHIWENNLSKLGKKC